MTRQWAKASPRWGTAAAAAGNGSRDWDTGPGYITWVVVDGMAPHLGSSRFAEPAVEWLVPLRSWMHAAAPQRCDRRHIICHQLPCWHE